MTAQPIEPKPEKVKKQPWQGHGLKIVLGILVSLVFMGMALYKIDLHELVKTFKQINPGWLIIAAACILVTFYTRSLVWFHLLKQHKRIHLWNAFRIIIIGYFANNILPLKLGELIRVWVLAKREEISSSVTLAMVILERGMDLLCLLIFFMLMMFLVPFEGWLKLSGILLASIGGGFFLVVLLNYRFGGHLLEKIEKPLQYLPGNIGQWLHRQMDKFLEGMKLIKTPGQFIQAFLFSFISWLGWIAVTYICFQAAGLQLPFFAAIFVIVVLNMGLAIPSSPGGLGVFEFMIILALATYGIGKETALGFAFMYHMIQYAVVILFGWFFVIQMNISMLKTSQSVAEQEDTVSASGTSQ